MTAEDLFERLSSLLHEVIARSGCDKDEILPTLIVPQGILDIFLDMYACWTGRPGIEAAATVETSALEDFRKSIPAGYFGDGEIVLDNTTVALRKDDTLTNDIYIRLYNTKTANESEES